MKRDMIFVITKEEMKDMYAGNTLGLIKNLLKFFANNYEENMTGRVDGPYTNAKRDSLFLIEVDGSSKDSDIDLSSYGTETIQGP